MTTINIGTTPNDGLGDKLRDAFIIVNENFASVGDMVTPEQLAEALSDYATKVYVDEADGELQDQIDNLDGRLDTNESDIAALEIDVTNLGLLIDGKASLTQLNNSVSNINSSIAALQIVVDNKIEEAPSDDKTYGRRNENWEEITGGGSLAYKVYSVMINQTGSSNNYQNSDYNTNDIVIGRTYKIVTKTPGCDFTTIGAPNSNEQTYFVATGTSPNWGDSNDALLEYDSAAPVVTILQNTIGNLVWFYLETGVYYCVVLDNGQDPLSTFIESKTPTLSYIAGNNLLDNNSVVTLIVSRRDDQELRLRNIEARSGLLDEITNEFIEIRVYN